MALVRKKGTTHWWMDISVPKALQPVHGPRIRKTTGTDDRTLAQQLHDKVKHDLWAQVKLGEKPKFTLRQAITRWSKYAAEKKLRSVSDVKRQLEWWASVLGENKPVGDIKRPDIMKAVEGMMTTPKNKREQPRQAEPATINRYLAAIRGLLKLCAGQWEMTDSAPTISMRSEPKGRVRTLTPAEMRAVFSGLPQHWRPIYMLALSTGLRASNVVRLAWQQVDLVRSRLLVGSEDFKNGEDFGIPLNDTAIAILKQCVGGHATHVFTYNGEPLKGLSNKTWKKALKRAGIENFRWHDIRHCWATMMLESGADLDELQALGGWKSREMVRRYAHMRTEHLRGAATKIDTTLGQMVHPS